MASTSYPSVTLPELPQRFIRKISFLRSFQSTHFLKNSKNFVGARIVNGYESNFSLRCSIADVDSTKEKRTPSQNEVKTWYTHSIFLLILVIVCVSESVNHLFVVFRLLRLQN